MLLLSDLSRRRSPPPVSDKPVFDHRWSPHSNCPLRLAAHGGGFRVAGSPPRTTFLSPVPRPRCPQSHDRAPLPEFAGCWDSFVLKISSLRLYFTFMSILTLILHFSDFFTAAAVSARLVTVGTSDVLMQLDNVTLPPSSRPARLCRGCAA